jgi:hypothetical protein
MRAILSLIVLSVAFAETTSARQQRDGSIAPPVAGTGSISGLVLDAESGAPIRYATVHVSAGVSSVAESINSDKSGAFRFDRIAAGRYLLSVYANGYTPNVPNAIDGKQPAVRVVVANGQAVTGVRILMQRQAVVSGVLSTAEREPFANVAVSLYRWRTGAPGEEPTLVSVGTAQTDDRGAYRVSVPPGEYVIASNGEPMMGGLRGDNSSAPRSALTHADVDAVRQGTAVPARDDGSSTRRMMNAPTYFPGTTRVSEAVQMTVSAGEERSGIDFAMQTVTATRIRGRIVPGDGSPVRRGSLHIFPTGMDTSPFRSMQFGSVSADGSFVTEAVPPGEYLLSAQTFTPRAGAAGNESSQLDVWSGSAVVNVVDGVAAPDIVITTVPGTKISGRVKFEGATPTLDQLASLRIQLKAVLSAGEINVGAPAATVEPTGAFTLSSVRTGKYVADLGRSGPGAGTWQDWWVKSAIVNGQNISDVPAELGSADVQGLVITLSNRPAQLSGTVTAADGTPGWGTVVLFAADPTHWRVDSRRVTLAPVDATGTFRLPRLVPGDYFIASTERLPARITDAAFLQALIGSAIRVTLAEGEQKVVELRGR